MGGDVLVELGHPFAANEVALPAQGQGIRPFRFKSIQPNGRDVTPWSVIVEVHLTANRRVCHIKHPSDFCGLKGGGAFEQPEKNYFFNNLLFQIKKIQTRLLTEYPVNLTIHDIDDHLASPAHQGRVQMAAEGGIACV
jgi:hypothetical protein